MALSNLSLLNILRSDSDLQSSYSSAHVTTYSICINMSQEGWQQSKHLFPKVPGIYVLTGEYCHTERVFRIGMAAGTRGIYGRWFEQPTCHYKAWRNPSSRTQCYHFFYSQLAELCSKVTLHFLLCSNPKNTILKIEKALISKLDPIWEKNGSDGLPAFKEQGLNARGAAYNLKSILHGK